MIGELVDGPAVVGALEVGAKLGARVELPNSSAALVGGWVVE